MRYFVYTLLIGIIIILSSSCDDNIDKENTLIGKWRFEIFRADVSTNDSLATTIIQKDIESVNNRGNHIFIYEFMTDGIYVLYDADSDDKLVGKYEQSSDSITIKDGDSNIYQALKTSDKYFQLYLQEVSSAYTTDSLRKLGITNPDSIIINKAWLTSIYKRVGA